MAIITNDDLASYLRDPSLSSDTTVGLFVDLANGVVEDVTGTLATAPTRVKAITLEVAARAYRNPNGYSSETVDDYTYRRDADTRQAGVYLTAGERSELLSFTTTPQRTAYTVAMASPLDLP